MYVKKIRLSGVRGFSGARSVDLDLTRADGSLAGLTVLAGRNGAGKTTLLRAVALALAGPTVARNLVTGFEDWVSNSARVGRVEVQLVVDPADDRLQGTAAPHGTRSGFWVGLSWEKAEDTASTSRRQPQPTLSEALERNKRNRRLPAQGPWSDNPSGWFSAGYGPFRRLAGGATETQRLMMGPAPVARLVTLFHEDASLAESVTWLIDQHLRRLEERPGAAQLLRDVLDLLGDALLPDGYTIDKVDADGLWVTFGDQTLALQEMSDGFRTIAALVLDIIRQLHECYGRLPTERGPHAVHVTVPGVVLVDELDVHLHVTWQKRIGPWLKTHFPRLQFIVTSHSPYICQAADPRGLVRLAGPGEQSPPTVVSDEVYERIIYGGGDDAAVSELFGLDSPYSGAAEQVRDELLELETQISTGEFSDGQLVRYRQLTERLARPLLARVEDVVAAQGLRR